LLLAVAPAARALDTSVFVTGHDPIWHAGEGGNFTGAANLARTGIEFARDGDTNPFLFVEAKTAPVPAGNAYTAPFLMSELGYGPGDYVQMDAADLAALPDFRAALSGYSAIVVASDHGGMLTSAELGLPERPRERRPRLPRRGRRPLRRGREQRHRQHRLDAALRRSGSRTPT